MVLSNNAFERTVGHRGPRLAAAQRWWPAAQLGRYTAPRRPLRNALVNALAERGATNRSGC
jgi:hypothetical protein